MNDLNHPLSASSSSSSVPLPGDPSDSIPAGGTNKRPSSPASLSRKRTPAADRVVQWAAPSRIQSQTASSSASLASQPRPSPLPLPYPSSSSSAARAAQISASIFDEPASSSMPLPSLPLPVFQGEWSQSAMSAADPLAHLETAAPLTKRCPDTPCKRSQARQCAFMAKANLLQNAREMNWNGQKITILEGIGKGDYSNVYKCQSDGPLGANYVLKIPRMTRLSMTCVRSVLTQYAQCKTLGISVADFANLNTYIEDPEFQQLVKDKNQRGLLEYIKRKVTDGCYLVRYIHTPIAFWDAVTPFIEPSDPRDPWAQIKEMFRLAYQHRIPLDLKRTNVGIFQDPSDVSHADNGKLFIYDLQEAEEEGDFTDNAFAVDVDNCLNTFTNNPALRNYLDPRL